MNVTGMLLARFRLIAAVLLLTLLVVGCADEGITEQAGASSNAVTNVAPKQAISDLKAATDTKNTTDARLGNALGRIGGVLNADQSAAFAQAWNNLPDVAAAETDYQTKAQTLADALDQVAADPDQIKSYGPKNLVAGYALLAKTPQGADALAFGTKAMAHVIVLDGVADQDILDQVIGPSLANAYLANLMKSGTVPSATAATVAALSTGTGVSLTIAGWLQRYNAFQQVDVLDDFLGISSDNTIAGLRTIAGIIAIWTIGDDVFQGDAQKAITDFLNSGGNAVTGIASATSLFRQICMGVAKTPLADSVMKWSGKIATGVGLVMNAIQLWNDAGHWNDSADAKVQVAIDVISLAASIACLVSTGPIGPALATVALGLSFFDEWLKNRRIAAQELADVKACLPAVGLDPTLTQNIINADPALIADITKNVGLAPDSAQWLITTAPDLVNADTANGVSFTGLQLAQKIFTLDAAGTDALLKATVGDATGSDAQARLDLFIRGLDFSPGWMGDLTTDTALDWLTQEEADPVAGSNDTTNQTAAFTNAHDYLAAL